MDGEEELADHLDDASNFAEAAGSVPLEDEDVDEEQHEVDVWDHKDANCVKFREEHELGDLCLVDEDHEEPGQDGEDAGDDPRPAEEGDGRGDSHLAAVALQSELVQHATVSSQFCNVNE